MGIKIFFTFKIGYILIDLNWIYPIKSSEFKISSYDEKTAENYGYYYVAEKTIVSKLSKISILNLDSINLTLEWSLC